MHNWGREQRGSGEGSGEVHNSKTHELKRKKLETGMPDKSGSPLWKGHQLNSSKGRESNDATGKSILGGSGRKKGKAA